MKLEIESEDEVTDDNDSDFADTSYEAGSKRPLKKVYRDPVKRMEILDYWLHNGKLRSFKSVQNRYKKLTYENTLYRWKKMYLTDEDKENKKPNKSQASKKSKRKCMFFAIYVIDEHYIAK